MTTVERSLEHETFKAGFNLSAAEPRSTIQPFHRGFIIQTGPWGARKNLINKYSSPNSLFLSLSLAYSQTLTHKLTQTYTHTLTHPYCPYIRTLTHTQTSTRVTHNQMHTQAQTITNSLKHTNSRIPGAPLIPRSVKIHLTAPSLCRQYWALIRKEAS